MFLPLEGGRERERREGKTDIIQGRGNADSVTEREKETGNGMKINNAISE